jgi:hypothetical protein
MKRTPAPSGKSFLRPARGEKVAEGRMRGASALTLLKNRLPASLKRYRRKTMDENDGNIEEKPVYGAEVLNEPWPWYLRKWVWIIGLLLIPSVLVYQYIHYHFYRPIEVTHEPWQVLDPGRPVTPLKFEVVQERGGTMVESGDLIQISLWRGTTGNKEIEQHDDDWWIWVGFRAKNETPFYGTSLQMVSTLVGQKEGMGIKFLESTKEGYSDAGTVHVNPFGSYNYYAQRKTGYSKSSRTIYIPFRSSPGYTIVYIKKVFKGQLKYRTTRLYDDTWIHYCSFFMNCKYINTPREGWVDEARYDGVSADGKRATFRYGPVATPGKEWKRPGSVPVSRGWIDNEWEKLPVGVQVE